MVAWPGGTRATLWCASLLAPLRLSFGLCLVSGKIEGSDFIWSNSEILQHNQTYTNTLQRCVSPIHLPRPHFPRLVFNYRSLFSANPPRDRMRRHKSSRRTAVLPFISDSTSLASLDRSDLTDPSSISVPLPIRLRHGQYPAAPPWSRTRKASCTMEWRKGPRSAGLLCVQLSPWMPRPTSHGGLTPCSTSHLTPLTHRFEEFTFVLLLASHQSVWCA
jgi:hypothetical protein